MPWTAPIPMLSDRITIVKVISSNQQDFNLWDDCGNPTQPADVFVTISSGVTISTFVIGQWESSSVINLTNNGTILGRGGNGGDGGAGESTTDVPGYTCSFPGAAADAGGKGGNALTNFYDIDVQLDTDNGFIWAGAGGGGGGGSASGSGGGYGGGGGGGGRGWNVSSGGTGGAGSFSPFKADDGASGGPTGGGAGGDGQPTGATDFGGDGGAGGSQYGDSGSGGASGSGQTVNCSGGAGGAAGEAVSGSASTTTLTGAKNKATLISESRLLGGTSAIA